MTIPDIDHYSAMLILAEERPSQDDRGRGQGDADHHLTREKLRRMEQTASG